MFGAYLINLINEQVTFTWSRTEAKKRAIVRRSVSFARALTSKTKLLFVPREHVSSEKVGKLPSLIPIVNMSGCGGGAGGHGLGFNHCVIVALHLTSAVASRSYFVFGNNSKRINTSHFSKHFFRVPSNWPATAAPFNLTQPNLT